MNRAERRRRTFWKRNQRIKRLHERLGGEFWYCTWSEELVPRWDPSVRHKATNQYPFSGEERRMREEYRPILPKIKELRRDFSDGD